ncbi:MAG: anhydro-N-acetylmuramic acid kinase [candidate division Zixibacteria bacterium]|nr:anhydro-N-acetylmuramic acid kinase [candidate division Zixibacteria bacterium]
MLKRLLSKKQLYILGINSGTSADGIDLAIVKLSRIGKTIKSEFITGEIASYTGKVKKELESLITAENLSDEILARYDIAFGKYLGKIASTFASKQEYSIDLVASHGQTIGHYPKKKSLLGYKTGATMQIGDGNAIACESGLPIVSDFRRTDIALGGEGAPLTPHVNQILFSHKTKRRIIVNIGGIANYSYLATGRDMSKISGADCGPGNTLIDIAMFLLYKKPFDKDGKIARTGNVIPAIVSEISRINRRKNKSTGRELFSSAFVARLLKKHAECSRADIIASLTEATVREMFVSIKKHLKPNPDGVFLTGGGRRNLVIVEQLGRLCDPVRVLPIEALGYDGDLVEAVSFAVLGGCYVYEIPSTLSNVTGARMGGIAGKLSLPAQVNAK